MNTDALKRSVESGELDAGARYAFALSIRSANALRNACSAAVSLLSLLAWAVSQVDPSTMPRATSSDALTSVGSIFRDCLYAQTDESFWPFKSYADPNAFQKAADLGKCATAARLKNSNC